MLRRTGCRLPVEMLFPAAEYPTPELVAALAQMGVTCRMLPDVVVQSSRKTKHPDSNAELVVDPMSGFTMKIAAVILSSFQEVIFLDSDNVAIDDVDPLFDSRHYRETGALLWPDYWASSAAPDVREILGLKSLPEGTSESGQMVFDKMRVWDALVLAAYFNMNSGFYYEMFSNFMGKGDKESFSFAFAATQTPYYMIPHPVGSLGVMRHYCSPDQSFCWEEFTGNTMTQYSPDGHLMFLHTNLSPKWNLMVPGDFEAYTRRWQVLVPGPQRFSRVEADWDRDVEFEIWQSIADFRCADFFRRYIEEHKRAEATSGRGLRIGLQGFHPQNEGVNFRQAYRWGLRGSYLNFTPVNVGDGVQHFKNTRIKPIGAWYRRVVLRMLQRNTYFRLW
ncbi:g5788 [Coccomyxa elongata]